MKITHLALPLALLALAGVEPAPAGRRAPEPLLAYQPVENLNDSSLVGRSGRATVFSGGRRTAVRLRRGERLVTMAEAGSGWVAAGRRERADGTDLVVVRQSSAASSAVDRLPSPGRGAGLHRLAPRLLVDNGELAGVAWLEGERPDRLAVRAAQWNGAHWTAAAVVAAPGPGSQTGLAQTILPDGSWLLVWSRFDGRENELYWSRRSSGNWTPAAPLESADGVPDVTPTLLATSDGALLAWSEYDGNDYRLRAARFSNGGWSELAIDAGRGALRPEFRRLATGTWVLVQSAAPRGWAAVEIGDGGARARIARVETEAIERPMLRAARAGSSSLIFEWAGSRRLIGRWETAR